MKGRVLVGNEKVQFQYDEKGNIGVQRKGGIGTDASSTCFMVWDVGNLYYGDLGGSLAWNILCNIFYWADNCNDISELCFYESEPVW